MDDSEQINVWRKGWFFLARSDNSENEWNVHWLLFKPGGLDSWDQSRSRRLDSSRQGFENLEIESLDRDSVKNQDKSRL